VEFINHHSSINLNKVRVMDDSSPLVGKPHPAACYAGSMPLRDPLPLELHVPTAPHRPGDTAQLAPFAEQPGDLERPDTLAPYETLHPHATGLIRVLDDEANAAGAWRPSLSSQQLRHGLEMMLRVRHFDARMMAMHRQGRLSFFVTSRGEEATSVAGAMAYANRDLLFPSYRQPGLMLVRGMPMLAMMCQSIGNRFDHTGGRQMPVHYSWRAGNVVSISSPVGTQLPQAVGAAMAFAYRGERSVVGTWAGDGTAAQGDFHHALNFASVYRPPCVLHVVDNQWAISTPRTLSTGGRTFAARADAYSLPGLRVDGNDFLAVYAAEQWAIERARRGGGPTLIDLVTYRCDAHSTSDDTSQYRAANEPACWPGGDPIDRLKRCLINLHEWSEEAHVQLDDALEHEAMATFEHAESYGSIAEPSEMPAASLFDDVYVKMPDHLQRQLEELQAESTEQDERVPSVPFVKPQHRAVG
jgi:2-oxoisovalerate dehydrogenase E1 component alpha subunit